METSSVLQLCLQLISSAIRRCRVSEQLCRVSVLLKCFPASDCSAVGVSISDTGIGSRLEEFQDLKYPYEDVGAKKTRKGNATESHSSSVVKAAGQYFYASHFVNADGVISVRTTNYCDNEIHHYQINLKESVSTRRLIRKPSNLKNGAKFSGTEVYLLISESINVLLEEMSSYFQKILILKIPNVITELAVERGDIQGSQGGTVFIQNGCSDHPLSASNLDRLKMGIEDYVLKHGYRLKCDSCRPSRKILKVGAGMLSCTEKHKKLGLVAEAVVAISQASRPTNTCVKACALETRVVWFKDFAPCSTSPAFLKALAGIDWKRYGLILASTIDRGYHALLKWENLPSDTHMDIVIHCYHGHLKIKSPIVKNSQISQSLIKNAVKQALDDLKQNHGVLLSARALKISSHAPDLARTMAGLILNSNDADFQEECFSLLGLQFQEADIETVKENIKDKIISVIEMNDRIPPGMKEVPPFLFEDEHIQEMETEDNKYEVSEDDLDSTSMQI